MKFFFFTCCIFSFQIVLGQKFTEVPTSSPIIRLNDSRADIADVDNDGDLDLIVAGEIELFSSVTILYKNNGLGLFTEVTDSKFEGVHYGAVAFVDIDGDQDQDLFITGENSTLKTVAKLYQNDGRGNFTEFEDTPFVNVANGKSAFSDIDGDQDQDLLLTGRTLFGQRTTNLYLNDGTGIFSEVTNTPFEGVDDSVVDFLDVDGDQDQDLLIMGSDGSFYGITKLYLNDGNGNFNEVENTPFFQRSDGSIASGDIDGDLDQDVIISGIFTDVFGDVKLYLNDGNGNFMEANSPFEGTSEVVMVDIDNDGDQDVITTGYSESFSLVARLYFNIGEGEFLNIVGNTFNAVADSDIIVSDIDGDNDLDLVITGETDTGYETSLYLNNGLGVFTEHKDQPFDGVKAGTLSCFDVDLDQDNDLFITGINNTEAPIFKLYLNEIENITSTDLIHQKPLTLEVFPNPFENKIFIKGVSGKENYTLLNAIGNIVSTGTINSNMDFDHLSTGIYFLTIQIEGSRSTIKLIKK